MPGPRDLGQAGFWVTGVGRSPSPGEADLPEILNAWVPWAVTERGSSWAGDAFLPGCKRTCRSAPFPGTGFHTLRSPQPALKIYRPTPTSPARRSRVKGVSIARVGRGFLAPWGDLCAGVRGDSPAPREETGFEPAGGERRGGAAGGAPSLRTSHLGGARECGSPAEQSCGARRAKGCGHRVRESPADPGPAQRWAVPFAAPR